MWKIETAVSIKLGGNTYINTPNLIVHKGEPMFQICRSDSGGCFSIDFTVFDAHGNRAATIRRGVVVQGDASNYIIEMSQRHYVVTEQSTGQQIAVIHRRGVDGAELEVSVCLYTLDGFLFCATPTQTNIDGLASIGCTVVNGTFGIAFG